MRRLFEGNPYVYSRSSSGHDWDDHDVPHVFYEIDNDGDDLWRLSFNEPCKAPDVYLNLKAVAKSAGLNEKETEVLLQSVDPEYELDVDFFSFSTEGVERDAGWGDTTGWYHDVFTVEKDPKFEDFAFEDEFDYGRYEGELSDEEIQVILEKLKTVDYSDNIDEMEYDEEERF